MTSVEPNLNVEALRNMIKGDNIDYNAAERIANAINAALNTKNDMSALEKELKLEILDIKDFVHNRLRLAQNDIIFWIVGAQLAFSQGPSIFNWLGKLTGKW